MDSTININLVPKDEIKVFYGTEAHIDNKASVLFIKSGEAEIQNYVDNVSKPEISNYVETEAKPLVTQIINEIAEPTVAEYIETTVKPEIDDYTDSLKPDLEAYATQANASAIASAASAAEAKTSENNALSSKNSAATSAQNAANSATEAEGYAQDAASSASLANIENKITNCITAIPQDIKLELNDGTLTLKAGSKVYIPNGPGVFVERTASSDISRETFGSETNSKVLIFVTCGTNPTSGNLSLTWGNQNNTSSGTTPTDVSQIFYDTDDNTIWLYNSGVKNDQRSLPIAEVTMSNGTVTSIDQVFNGFGYIGSTIFALPGVEGLIPNYRNVDGSLNNVEWTCNSVIARTISGFGNYDYYLGFNGQGFSLIRDYLYNQDENINLTQSVSWPSTWVGNIRLNSDVITSFKPKTTFQAADYYDVPKLATDNTFTGVNTFNDTIYTNIRGVILSNEINDNQDIPPSEITDGTIFLNRSKTTSAGHDGVNSWIYGIRQLNGTNTVGMSTRKYINGVEKTSFVNCHVYPDGSAYAFCPTPPTTANGTEIATAAWVRQVLNARLDTNLSNISTTGKQNILMWGIPNYNAGVAKNKDVDYTAESCGYLLEFSDASASGESSKIIVNNVTVARIGFVGTVGGTMWSAAFVNKGDRYRFAGVTSTSRTFFPLRGGA